MSEIGNQDIRWKQRFQSGYITNAEDWLQALLRFTSMMMKSYPVC